MTNFEIQPCTRGSVLDSNVITITTQVKRVCTQCVNVMYVK
jgi:hypothetical protein